MPPRRVGRRATAATTTGFTLVELLVVMGIISVLLAATLPALRGLTGMSGRRGAVTSLLGALDQARALAISEGRATYVVFLRPVTGQNATPDPRKIGVGYAIFQDADNVGFKPVQRSNWLMLPVGVAFKTDDAKGSTASVLNRPLLTTDPTFLVPVSNGSSQEIPQPFVKFDSTGAADVPATYARVLLFEGSLDPATGAERPTKRAAGGSDPATQRFMWEEIRLNYATGRARYTPDPADILVATATPSPTP